MQLTDEQARILAACAVCSRQLQWRSVKPYLQTGNAHPPEIYCCRCGDAKKRGEIPTGVALIAAHKLWERIRRAGLTAHYERVAHDAYMREKNRQN